MVPVRALLVAAVVVSLLAPATAGHATDDGPPLVGSDRHTPGAVDRSPVDERYPIDDRRSTRASAPATDNTVTRIAVQEDGDARWTVRIRTRLDSDADVEEYRSFQRRFRENTSRFLDPFAERMGGIVGRASNVTGREMTARNFTATTSVQEVPRRWGVVSFAFTWTNFASRDGDALVVGDVFEGGLFLAENDSLVVEAPQGYAVAAVEPEPSSDDGDAVTWEGREDFADRRPRVEMEPTGTPTGGTSSPSASDPGAGPSLSVLALVAVGLAAGIGAAVYVRRRRPATRVVPTAGEDGAVGGDGDPLVLTDAERVEQLLAENGGRMKQADVADVLGWSASKTSRVVSDMVEADRVEKLRIGRENVLDLPE